MSQATGVSSHCPQWAVAVPAKSLPAAKSRLAPALNSTQRRALALAMLTDVVRALQASPLVGAVAVVTSDPELTALAGAMNAHALPDPSVSVSTSQRFALSASPTGLTVEGEAAFRAAARAGADWAARQSPLRAVLSADVPGVTAAEITSCLSIAAGKPRGFVVDADSTGTTMATFTGGASHQVFFGPQSAQRFAQSGAVALGTADQWIGLRRDVDLPHHLAQLPPCGKATTAVIQQQFNDSVAGSRNLPHHTSATGWLSAQ